MKRILLVVITLILAQAVFSQITNTRRWRKTEKDSLNNALLLYEENQYLMALPFFQHILRNHPNEEFIQYSFAKCGLYRSDTHEEAYKYLSAIYAKNKKVDEIDYDVAKAAHFTNHLPEALADVNHYLTKHHLTPEKRAKGELLKRYINNAIYYEAIPTAAKVTNLGDAINTEGEEYVPAITADESTLIFTYSGPNSTGGLVNDLSVADPQGTYHEDIYISRKKDNQFQPAQALTNLNTDGNDAAVSLSNDGNLLYIFRDNTDDHGDLYESHLLGTMYENPSKIKGLVNSYSWDGHCSLAPDGKTLYFSSERGGGYGGKDIYRATLQPDSTWGNIVNLGDSVNSKDNDDAPFIHPDGVTLYFSTTGRSSMGGYDVYRSTMNPVDSTFKKTESLGYPINSTDDDIYFVIGANNKNAYYSSGRSGGKGLKDIYLIDPAFANVKAALCLVKGTVKVDSAGVAAAITVENTSKPAPAPMTVTSAVKDSSGKTSTIKDSTAKAPVAMDNGMGKTNAVYANLMSNSSTGAYLVSLPAGSNYKLTYSLAGQPSQTFTVDATSLTDYSEKINNVLFKGIKAAAEDTSQVARAKRDSLAAVASHTAILIPKNLPDPLVKTTRDNTPQTRYQEKLQSYAGRYGDIKADDLEFRVQIGAFKNADNIIYPNLEGLGKIEKLAPENGITKVVIGSSYKTLRKAHEFNKKVIEAGQSDAFVAIFYKNKRASLEELETLGIFKATK